MSSELPVWNDAETDILPEFRLTFGHALIEGEPDVSRVAKAIGLKILDHHVFCGDELPCGVGGKFEFERGGTTYAVVSVHDGATCVFTDRMRFLNSRQWLRFSKSHRIAVVTQQDRDDYFYSVFEKGKVVASAVTERGKLRIIGPSSVNVTVNDTVVASAEANPKAPAWTRSFLARDMRLVITPDLGVKVLTSEDHEVKPISLLICS